MWAIWGSRDGLGVWLGHLGGLRLSISPLLQALHVGFVRYRHGIMLLFRIYPIPTSVGSIELADQRDVVISGTV